MEMTESEVASLLLASESPTHDHQTTNSHVGMVIGTGPSPVEALAGSGGEGVQRSPVVWIHRLWPLTSIRLL